MSVGKEKSPTMLLVVLDGIAPRLPCMCIDTFSEVSISEVATLVEEKYSIPTSDLYFVHNGKRVSRDASFSEGVIHASFSVIGGKGGFGSMLRAIGAQIEKTTNREACRDLSGRRLRDINEEKRLKNWINLKAEREREAMERKRRKLEKLSSEPKHDFSDKMYDEERSKLTSEVSDAVEKGFQVASVKPGPSMSSVKPKKSFMFEDEEITSEGSTDSEDEAASSPVSKQVKRKKGGAESASSSETEQVASSSHISKRVKHKEGESESSKSSSDSEHEVSSSYDSNLVKRKKEESESSASSSDTDDEVSHSPVSIKLNRMQR